ncbi:hypothetical protein [Ferruginibacter sp.]
MKKFILIVTLCLGGFFAARAQDTQPGEETQRQEKIQALYVAYITQQLQLTPDEAKEFWPMHTQFTNELKAVKQDQPELDKQQAVLNIKKKYQAGFTKILGSNRCEQFYTIDRDFKKKLLERIRKQNPNIQRPKLRRGI